MSIKYITKMRILSGLRRYSLPEYTAKQLLGDYGVKIQRGIVADSADTAYHLSSTLKAPYIVKANVPVGGRGLGRLSGGLEGGVHQCASTSQVKDLASQMIGFNLITKQTPLEGLPVTSVIVNESIDIKKQVYLAIVLDPLYQGPVLIYSEEGGVDIERTAKDQPSSIKYFPISKSGLTIEEAQRITKELNIDNEQASHDILRLYNLFVEKDCLQVEINPWATTPNSEVYCVDAKVSIDDNSLFRHQEFNATSELNYVELNGNIACMVNGAGLAMATMDILNMKGGKPANFLDIGGTASPEQISRSLDLLLHKEQVKTVFVNVFAGILRCDVIAESLVKYLEKNEVSLPIVVRFQGNKVEEAKVVLDSRNFKGIYVENNMEKAAELCVSLSN